VVTNLVNTHHDAQGNEIIGSSVTNRPWEWIENLGEPSVLDVKEDEREKGRCSNSKYLPVVKNSGSISLDHFGARLTGDGIKHEMATSDSVDSRTASSIRSFEDGCSEHLFIRDWRESRLEWDIETSTETMFRLKVELDPDASGISDGLSVTAPQGQRTSPSSSVVSGTGSSLSMRQSPSHTIQSRTTNSTVQDIEIIDVDSVPTTSLRKESLKRKVVAGDSDDEIEIIEGPVVTRVATSSKRQKIVKVPAGKTKAKKK
jgi:mediator of RNA polymerase II transcription subunit 12